MLFGNPDRFAFLIELVPEWISEPFINSLMYVYVNGEIFPKDLRVTTLSDDLQFLLNKERPYGMYYLVNDKELYALSDEELFSRLRFARFNAHFTDDETAVEDYSFDLELIELNDSGYDLFAVGNGENVRILVGHWVDPDGEELEGSFALVNSVEITVEEFTKIRDELREYYEKEILR